MACTAFQALDFATELLTDDIYLRALPASPWMNLIPREAWPMGKGTVSTNYLYERIAPAVDERVWTPLTVGAPSYGPGFCGATYTSITGGFTKRTYSPSQFDLKGEVLCETDMTFGHDATRFIDLYVQAIAKESRMELENQLAYQYALAVPAWVCTQNQANFGPTAIGAGYGNALLQATSDLQQQHLDIIAATLSQEGAFMDNSNGWMYFGSMGPVYSLFIGQQTAERIFQNNTDFRENVRFADMGMGDEARTILRLGSSFQIKNFRHHINLFPPRYTYNAGTSQYVRVNTWSTVAASVGTKAVVNSSWLTAPYEAAYVMNPWAIKEEPVAPASAGLQWEPINYFGEWRWITGAWRVIDPNSQLCYDPWAELGAHFAKYKHAIAPMEPQFGAWVVFLNCAGTAVKDVFCS